MNAMRRTPWVPARCSIASRIPAALSLRTLGMPWSSIPMLTLGIPAKRSMKAWNCSGERWLVCVPDAITSASTAPFLMYSKITLPWYWWPYGDRRTFPEKMTRFASWVAHQSLTPPMMRRAYPETSWSTSSPSVIRPVTFSRSPAVYSTVHQPQEATPPGLEGSTMKRKGRASRTARADRFIFQHAAVALWEMDISSLRLLIRQWKNTVRQRHSRPPRRSP